MHKTIYPWFHVYLHKKSKIKIIIFFDITKKVEAFKVKNVAAVD